MTTLDAKVELEAQGLHVSNSNANSLWIADQVRDAGQGILQSDNACALIHDSGRWVAVFPAEGQLTYEIPGSLPELVSVIAAVYAQHRQAGGPFREAIKKVVDTPQQYLVGRSLARV